jgi:hypothetical protein
VKAKASPDPNPGDFSALFNPGLSTGEEFADSFAGIVVLMTVNSFFFNNRFGVPGIGVSSTQFVDEGSSDITVISCSMLFSCVAGWFFGSTLATTLTNGLGRLD